MPQYDGPASNGVGGVIAQADNQDSYDLGHRMARAYAHPLRARALMILGARVASPKEIAEELGEPLGKISYHVRELRDAGLIELIDTDGRRGGVQHFYRATALPVVSTEEMVALDAGDRTTSSAVVMNLMVSDVAAAISGGTLDSRPDRALIRYHAIVDDEGFRALSELYDRVLDRSIEIHEEAARAAGGIG